MAAGSGLKGIQHATAIASPMLHSSKIVAAGAMLAAKLTSSSVTSDAGTYASTSCMKYTDAQEYFGSRNALFTFQNPAKK
jgi:hypothetical protein